MKSSMKLFSELESIDSFRQCLDYLLWSRIWIIQKNIINWNLNPRQYLLTTPSNKGRNGSEIPLKGLTNAARARQKHQHKHEKNQFGNKPACPAWLRGFPPRWHHRRFTLDQSDRFLLILVVRRVSVLVVSRPPRFWHRDLHRDVFIVFFELRRFGLLFLLLLLLLFGGKVLPAWDQRSLGSAEAPEDPTCWGFSRFWGDSDYDFLRFPEIFESQGMLKNLRESQGISDWMLKNLRKYPKKCCLEIRVWRVALSHHSFRSIHLQIGDSRLINGCTDNPDRRHHGHQDSAFATRFSFETSFGGDGTNIFALGTGWLQHFCRLIWWF